MWAHNDLRVSTRYTLPVASLSEIRRKKKDYGNVFIFFLFQSKLHSRYYVDEQFENVMYVWCVAFVHCTVNIMEISNYTECPGGHVPDFGRMFLTLKYTDIAQNTYTRSWTVTEIMAREKCGLLVVPRTVPVSRVVTLHCECPSFSLTTESSTFRLHYQQMSQLQWIVIQYCWIFTCHVKCLEP